MRLMVPSNSELEGATLPLSMTTAVAGRRFKDGGMFGAGKRQERRGENDQYVCAAVFHRMTSITGCPRFIKPQGKSRPVCAEMQVPDSTGKLNEKVFPNPERRPGSEGLPALAEGNAQFDADKGFTGLGIVNGDFGLDLRGAKFAKQGHRIMWEHKAGSRGRSPGHPRCYN